VVPAESGGSIEEERSAYAQLSTVAGVALFSGGLAKPSDSFWARDTADARRLRVFEISIGQSFTQLDVAGGREVLGVDAPLCDSRRTHKGRRDWRLPSPYCQGRTAVLIYRRP